MKNEKNRWIAAFLVFVLLVLTIPMLTTSVNAQTRYYYYKDRAGRVHRTTKKPSFYRRHRNRSNVALGTGAGAIIGAIAGGKKGALIGAAAGAGGSALYTYKLKKKKRHYIKRRY